MAENAAFPDGLWLKLSPSAKRFFVKLGEQLEGGFEGELRVVCHERGIKEATVVRADLLALPRLS